MTQFGGGRFDDGTRARRFVESTVRRGHDNVLRLTGRVPKPPASAVRDLPPLPNSPVVVGIGPANFAGQAWAWKQSVERYLDGVSAEVFAVRAAGLDFPADRLLEAGWYRDRGWQQAQRNRILNGYTHLIAEAVRPVFGLRYGNTLAADLPVLRTARKPVAILLHGSEIRRPDLHAGRYPHSPFSDPDHELAQVLQPQSVRLGRIVAAFLESGMGPVFVSTPDLLDDVPGGTWLPVVVDDEVWHGDLVPMRRARPVVVHVPSRAKMKGSDLIDPLVQGLADRGLIEYRRFSGIAAADMPALIADADIVLDQFALGSYGVSAVQAMAAGRVTVGHVADHVRARIGVPLPIVEATPVTIVEVLERLVAEPEAARTTAADGVAFARAVHNGRRSAEVLATFLGRPLRVG